jgi:heat shock protein HslJ
MWRNEAQDADNRIRTRSRLAILVLAFLALLTACGSSIHQAHVTPILPTATPPAKLAQTTWRLTRLVLDGHEQSLVQNRAPTLRFHPQAGQAVGVGAFSSYDGCNSWGAQYTLAGEAIRFGGEGSRTQMLCGDDIMTVAAAFYHALLRATRFRLEGTTLILTSGDGSAQLPFQATPCDTTGESRARMAATTMLSGTPPPATPCASA